MQTMRSKLQEDQLWYKIRVAAQTNTALQAELDRVIMFYYLSKKNGTKDD
jgi:hypothetical protein